MILNILYILLQPYTDAQRDSMLTEIDRATGATFNMVFLLWFAFFGVVFAVIVALIIHRIREPKR